MYRESRFKNTARLVTKVGQKLKIGNKIKTITTPEDSRGLFQINILAHTWAKQYNLYNPHVNIHIAYTIWKRFGWKPWSTFKEIKK